MPPILIHLQRSRKGADKTGISPYIQLWDFLELLFVYFVYIETKGPTLEEIARIFDGDDAAAAHIDFDQVGKEMAITSAAEHHEDLDSAKMRRPMDA